MQPEKIPSPRNKIFIDATNFSKEELVTITILEVSGKIAESINILSDGKGTFSKNISLNKSMKKGVYLININATSISVQKKLIINYKR